MQLVVDIPEDTFFDLKKKQNRTEVDNAVLNGIPILKGYRIREDTDRLKCSKCRVMHYFIAQYSTDNIVVTK